MFSRIIRMRSTRWTASFLILSLILTLTITINPIEAQAKAQQPEISIAAVGIENLTNYEILTEDHGVEMLLAEISGLDNVNIVSRNKVLESLDDMEPNPDVAISVGRAVGAEAVLVGFVSNLQFNGTELAECEIGLSLYNVDDGRLLSEAVVVGRSSRLGFSGSLEELAELAIRDGVRTAMGFVFENLNSFGVVTIIKGDTVFCNLAERDKVRPGAEIAIFKKGTNMQIASIEVGDVSIAHSSGKIISQQAGVAVGVGDPVRLIYTPVVIEFTGGQKQVPKKKKFSPLLIGIVAVGLIAAVSSGGNKAEPPQPQTGPSVVSSSKAAVYSASPFDPDYMPAPPKPIDNLSSNSQVASCLNSNSAITVLEDTAHDFYLSSSPKDSNLPGSGYTIAFDLADLRNKNGGFTDLESGNDDTTNLKCATCNSDTGKWEIITGTYNKVSYLNNNWGLTCKATHFTPYVVIIDDREDPLPAPATYLSCGDSKATLSWDAITSTNNSGYVIYNCTSTAATSCVEGETVSTSITTKDFIVSNGSQVCYAVSGKSSVDTQDAEMSDPKCTTPSSDPAACQLNAITLVSPGNTSTIQESPIFIFIGTGDMDYYVLEVTDASTNSVVYSTDKITGEGAASEERDTFSQTYSGADLQYNKQYRWQVTGFQNVGTSKQSESWSFTYKAGTDCCEMTDTPDAISPANGSSLKLIDPEFLWESVSCAESYLFQVMDSDGTVIDSQILNSNTTDYSGDTALADNGVYTWNVTAMNACSSNQYGNTFTFTKEPMDFDTDLPIPAWASGDGKQPITKGFQSDNKSSYVALNWERIDDTDVVGFMIYREKTLSEFDKTDYYQIIYKTQLGSPALDDNCPTFSQNDPGFCDTDVENGEKYFYWIAAIQQGDTPGNSSSPQSIQLDIPRPQLMSPGDVTAEIMTNDSPDFLWFPVTGVDIQYIINLKDTSSGNTIWEKITSATKETYLTALPALEKGITYSWTVKAFNNVVQSQESQTFRFTKDVTDSLPDAPNWCGGTYCSPNQSDSYSIYYVDNSITTYWEMPDSENISSFKIYRCQDAPGICDDEVAYTDNTACSTLMPNVVCFKDTYLDRGSTYSYAISAVDLGGTEGYKSLTINITMQLQGPKLIFPTYDQVIYVPQPEFTWLAEPGATEYSVQVVKKPDTFSNPTNLMWNYRVVAGNNADVLTALYNEDSSAKGPLINPSNPDLSGTQYQWRVCSRNYTQTDEKCSNPSQFYKNLKPPSTISPNSGEKLAVDTTTFEWTDVPGASGYEVRACKYDGGGTDCTTKPLVLNETTNSNTLSVDISEWDKCDINNDPTCANDGAYFWEVRAYDEYGGVSGNWENANRELFYVVFNEVPSPLIPQDGQIIGPDPTCPMVLDLYGDLTYQYYVHFEWVDTGDSPYTILIEEIDASDEISPPDDPDHMVTIYETTVADGSQVAINEDCSDNNIPLTAGRTYRWHVKGFSTPLDVSNSRTFITGLPAPNLESPQDAKQVILYDNCDNNSQNLCVHFDWNGGSQVGPNGDVNLPGVVGAASYDIEILANGLPFECKQQFTYDPLNEVPLTNTVHTFCDLSTTSALNNDVFIWRVRARDNSGVQTSSGYTGYPGPWSQHRQFTISIPPPVLAFPIDNSAVCDPFGSPATVEDDCSTVECTDQQFWWSPSPAALGSSCYRIDISDSPDFTNPILSDTTLANDPAFCTDYNCYMGTDIPMVNGVVYYWRVGSSVTPSGGGGQCGQNWNYSDTWEYMKRPPYPQNITFSAEQTTVTLSWDHPVNCSGTSPAVSYPPVPPNGGDYIVYVLDQANGAPDPATDRPRAIVGSNTTTVQITDLQADTTYTMCVAAVDDTHYYTNVGHVSRTICIAVTTAPEEE